MDWNLMFFLNSILLGVGLAMDAFSVSLANGLNEPKMGFSKMCLVAGCYAFFQFAMPLIGWVCVHTIVNHFRTFEKFIPWIALILLLYIGGKMLVDSLSSKNKDEDKSDFQKLTIGTLLIQGIATSIDALSVGFTIENYGLIMALVSSIIIAVVTFAISFGGLKIGKKFGTKLSNKAGILGGIILIGIGLEIFIRGIFFS